MPRPAATPVLMRDAADALYDCVLTITGFAH
jgi:hypothetical protein